MFKDANKNNKHTHTLLGQGTKMNGTLQCEANLRIEGRFHGVIESTHEIIIGETGEVHSSIKGSSIIIAGKVYGDVLTEGKCLITAKGQLDGNVTAHSLVIVEGGILNGISIMESATLIPDKVSTLQAIPRTEAG
ncbi:cytoskeletal protein CcmA (bactofilin family) [Paenibacillus shirakamiensis]|uniref:Cytoskeletal protein CcmA (Bactofilin family) n=1 Tax=Paenibacillus shirakamiensis TaxID=1265935 RepID=A0ABS4JG58_9BACL|nr:polymer-forming cytoskeletal protein [Paenibacillus shirakamiensis]MBP2000698.1 cytoskeletal protein CcmA (bactofilin family) [Paenibacillus shirakamiensis]